jgi:ABC-type arginine transport system ATPase subunit
MKVSEMTRVLDVKGLNGGYGAVQILYDIDLYVEEGEFVTIIVQMVVESQPLSKQFLV